MAHLFVRRCLELDPLGSSVSAARVELLNLMHCARPFMYLCEANREQPPAYLIIM